MNLHDIEPLDYSLKFKYAMYGMLYDVPFTQFKICLHYPRTESADSLSETAVKFLRKEEIIMGRSFVGRGFIIFFIVGIAAFLSLPRAFAEPKGTVVMFHAG